MTKPIFLEIELGGHELRCQYDFSPGTPDVMYLPNGDPGYPGDPEEFSVTKIELQYDDSLSVHPPVWIDLTDILADLGDEAAEKLDDIAREAFDKLADEPPEREEHDYDF